MNKLAIGQVITTAPVLVLVFVIMVIFIVLANIVGGIGAFVGGTDSVEIGSGDINSRILLELFLGDFVIFNGEKIKVEEVMLETLRGDSERVEELSGLLEGRFDNKYSCDGENLLVVTHEVAPNPGGGPGPQNFIRLLVDYPDGDGDWDNSVGTLQNHAIASSESHKKKLDEFGDVSLVVHVLGDVRC